MPLHSHLGISTSLGIFTSACISYSGGGYLLFLTQVYIFWRPPLITHPSSFALARCCMLPCDQRNPRSLFCGSMRKKGYEARTRLSLCSQSLRQLPPLPPRVLFARTRILSMRFLSLCGPITLRFCYLYLASAPPSPSQLLFIRVCLCFLLFPLFLGGKLHDKPLLCA